MGHNNNYTAKLVTRYTVQSFTHIKVMPINAQFDGIPIGSPFTDILVTQQHPGGPVFEISLDSVVVDWLALFKVPFKNTDSINAPELWVRDTPDDDWYWFSVFAAGDVGDQTGGTTPLAQQTCLTFRTAAGGLYKDFFMENVLLANNLKDPFPLSNVVFQAYADYVTSVDGSWIIGRDGAPALAGINLTTKTNDALRRKRFLAGS